MFRYPELSAGGTVRWDLGVCVIDSSAGRSTAVFLKKIDQYLNDNGIVYISGENGIHIGEVEDERYFLEFTEQLIEKILTVNEQLESEQLWYTEDVNGRKGFRWINIILRMLKKENEQVFPRRFLSLQIKSQG